MIGRGWYIGASCVAACFISCVAYAYPQTYLPTATAVLVVTLGQQTVEADPRLLYWYMPGVIGYSSRTSTDLVRAFLLYWYKTSYLVRCVYIPSAWYIVLITLHRILSY